MVRVRFIVCTILAYSRSGFFRWKFLVAQVRKMLSLYCVFENPLLTLQSLYLFLLSPVRCFHSIITIKSEEHSLCEQFEESKNAPIAPLPVSVGIAQELFSRKHPWQVTHMRSHSSLSRTAYRSQKAQCDLIMLLTKVVGTLVMAESYWRSFPHASLCFYYFHLSWP